MDDYTSLARLIWIGFLVLAALLMITGPYLGFRTKPAGVRFDQEVVEGHRLRATCVLLCALLPRLYGDAETKVVGRVTDPADAAVPNASILARNIATLVERRTTSNNEGIY